MKTCSKCGDSKPFDQFNKMTASADGRQRWCKACIAARNKAYREENPEADRERQRKWRDANRDQHNAAVRRWRKQNPEKYRASSRASAKKYRDANAKSVAAYKRAWREANAERIAVAEKQRYWSNREQSLRQSREYYQTNTERLKQQARLWRANNLEQAKIGERRRRSRKYCAVSQRWRLSECDALACFWCGRGLLGALPELDHVMPLSLGGADDETNMVRACRSCNRRKHAKHPLVWIAELVA